MDCRVADGLCSCLLLLKPGQVNLGQCQVRVLGQDTHENRKKLVPEETTAETCAGCHQERFDQYKAGKEKAVP